MKAKLTMDELNDIRVEVNGKTVLEMSGDGCNNGDWYYAIKSLLESIDVEVEET